MTWGTGHHNKDASGHSKEIEGYIDKTVEWMFTTPLRMEVGDTIRTFLSPTSVIDLGCDYGHMLYRIKSAMRNKSRPFDALGVDLYFDPKALVHDIKIVRADIQSATLHRMLNYATGMDLITLNHSLEHVENPHAVICNVRLMKPKYVFIAVPHCDSPWVSWDSHLSAWNETFLDHFMRMHDFEIAAGQTISLRNVRVSGPPVIRDPRGMTPPNEDKIEPLNEIWRIYRPCA